MLNITRGRLMLPLRVVISGVPGIGKSTLASCFPEPLFIDTEGSTNQLDVMRFDAPTSWQMLLNEVDAVINDPSLCQTLVIDTIDWAEKLCADHVCQANAWKSLESPGYGAGYRYMYEAFGRLLDKLSLLPPKGVNVVLTAHTALHRVEQPDQFGAYDKYELKLQSGQKSSNAALVREWADLYLFCNYKTMIIKENDKATKGKAMGGQRMMYTTARPSWDAKNRFGLPEEMEMKYENIAACIPVRSNGVGADNASILQDKNSAPDAPAGGSAGLAGGGSDRQPAASPDVSGMSVMQQKLRQLIAAEGFTEQQVVDAVTGRGAFVNVPISQYPDDFISALISDGWQIIKNDIINGNMPF